MANSDRQTLRAELREKFPRDHGQLLPALHYLHHEFGHLPDWAMEVVGWHLGIPSSEVYGAATSFSELRIKQPGSHIVRVCTGLGCTVNGAKRLVEIIETDLRVHPGSTTDDGNVTFEVTPCAFACGVAPVVEVNGNVIGSVTTDAMSDILREVSLS